MDKSAKVKQKEQVNARHQPPAQADFKELPSLLNEHIQNKRATGRKKDLADLEALGEV